MKVHSGLIGISNNTNARQRFFLAAPEMSRLSEDFKKQFGVTASKTKSHPDVQPAAVRKAHEAVDKIKAAILSHGNPFAAEGNLYGRFMVLARSSRDIDLKNAIWNYEFTLTPRALFAPDGSVLRCNDKSKLIHCLQHLVETKQTQQDMQEPASG